VAQPGKEAGTLYIPALGRTIKLVEWREDDFYDTICTADPSAAPALIAAGASFEFFRDLQQKNLQHTNLRTPRRIPAGSEFIMSRIALLPHQAFGNVIPTPSQITKLAYAATLTFKINDRLVSEGPLVKYQSGLGVTGSFVGALAAGATSEGGLATIGVPSASAAPNLMVAQPVQDDDDLQGTIDFRSNAWQAGAVMPTIPGIGITIFLHGFIKKPQGK
jgi:hypothetical protein